jgi:hypothetical protein
MTDKLFTKIPSHKKRIQINEEKVISFKNALYRQTRLEITPKRKPNFSAAKLPKYRYFKNIKLDDILVLRANLDIDNEEHKLWCRKIHRFLEFRFKSVPKRIRNNYPKRKNRILLIQNVITLLLEYYSETNDERYLSLAIKLLRNKSLSRTGLLYRNEIPQYSYNIIATYNIVKEL